MYAGLTVVLFPVIVNTDYTNLSLTCWLYAVLGGLFGALGNSYLVKALKNGELSVLGPINAYKSVVAMVIGFFMLKEIPSVYGVISVFFAIVFLQLKLTL